MVGKAHPTRLNLEPQTKNYKPQTINYKPSSLLTLKYHFVNNNPSVVESHLLFFQPKAIQQ
jgi:hypothetical protein